MLHFKESPTVKSSSGVKSWVRSFRYLSEGFSMDLADAKMRKEPLSLVNADWEKLGGDGRRAYYFQVCLTLGPLHLGSLPCANRCRSLQSMTPCWSFCVGATTQKLQHGVMD